MSYTQAEKLQIMLLCDIHRALGIEDSYDPDVIEEAITTDNNWAIGWKYQNLNDGSKTPPHVTFFVDTVDMYKILQYTYQHFSSDDRVEVESKLTNFHGEKSLVFPGFDGNNETDYLSVGYMLEKLGRFEGTDITKNSHMPCVDTYRRMLDVFLPARSKDWNHNKGISKESFIAVFQAKIHPSLR
ncbi:YfbU family protein [Rouxiella badensis]|uniref:YfbU family protein n=1 Tax=Rouxiella badensis TaxID=1646377 RepID=UPI003C4AC796